MLANPAAKFARPRVHFTQRSPFEKRSICVLPISVAEMYDWRGVVTKCCGGVHTHWSRTKVTEAVDRGEMAWCDRFHNVATFAVTATGTWQKSTSGGYAGMQLMRGGKGRAVPFMQREPSLI